MAFVLAGCVPALGPNYPSATGTISGRVVDSAGRSVAGANVMAIYYGPFVQLLPPAPNALVAAQTTTAADGTFRFVTTKHVQEFSARSRDFHLIGELRGVSQTGNLIRIHRPPPLPKPFTLRPGEKPPPPAQ